MSEMLDSAVEIQKTLTATTRPSGAQSSTTGTSRTLATPDWDGETVINLRQRLNLSGVSIPDFEAANQWLESNDVADAKCSYQVIMFTSESKPKISPTLSTPGDGITPRDLKSNLPIFLGWLVLPHLPGNQKFKWPLQRVVGYGCWTAVILQWMFAMVNSSDSTLGPGWRFLQAHPLEQCLHGFKQDVCVYGTVVTNKRNLWGFSKPSNVCQASRNLNRSLGFWTMTKRWWWLFPPQAKRFRLLPMPFALWQRTEAWQARMVDHTLEAKMKVGNFG